MANNKYFNSLYDNTEQDLFSDIIQEVIAINGYDVVYIVRDMEKMDELLREESLSAFRTTYIIDAYLETPESENMQRYMSKFGFRFEDNTEIVISTKSWEALPTGFPQPREGDMIYIGNPDVQYGAMINCMYQITQVSDNKSDTSRYGKVVSFRLSLSSANKSYSNIAETSYTDINDMLSVDKKKENKTTVKKVADEFADVNIVPMSNPLHKWGIDK